MNNQELVEKYGFKKSLIKNKSIQINCEAKDWQEAVAVTFAPLITAKAIEPAYIDAVIANTIKYGPYYIIGPNLAMPHADLRAAVHYTSFSIAVFKKAITFKADNTAQVFVGFASPSKNQHLTIAIPQVVATFENAEITKKVIAAKSVNEVLTILSSINENKYINLEE